MKLIKRNENNELEVADEVLMIKEFRAIVRRDRGTPGDTQGRKKLGAIKELAFIYFYVDFNSPYSAYRTDKDNLLLDVRFQKVRDAVGLPSSWFPDELIDAACDRYRELQHTLELDFLEAAQEAAHKIIDYFGEIDYSRTVQGKPIYNPKDTIMILKQAGATLDGIEDLRERVKRSLESSVKVHGGGKVGRREDPD
jgi:hypothetical protein